MCVLGGGSGGGKFYEHGNEAIIHYTAEQTRDYTGNYLTLAILPVCSSQICSIINSVYFSSDGSYFLLKIQFSESQTVF